MDYEVIKECTHLSDEGKITFQEVGRKLFDAGIDLYYADLLAPNKTFYAKNESYTVPSKQHSKKVADSFDVEGVKKAIRQVQAGEIQYSSFVDAIMEAGVICYMVFIKGRKVVYVGRKGEQHIENFPQKQS